MNMLLSITWWSYYRRQDCECCLSSNTIPLTVQVESVVGVWCEIKDLFWRPVNWQFYRDAGPLGVRVGDDISINVSRVTPGDSITCIGCLLYGSAMLEQEVKLECNNRKLLKMAIIFTPKGGKKKGGKEKGGKEKGRKAKQRKRKQGRKNKKEDFLSTPLFNPVTILELFNY